MTKINKLLSELESIPETKTRASEAGSENANKISIEPNLVIQHKFNNMFLNMRDNRNLEEVRTGLHASAVIASESDFCYRQQVLSLLYEMDQGKELPLGALKIFAAGSSIHEKWQTMFEKCSNNIPGFKLIRNEARSFSEKWNLFFTPDAIIEIDGQKYIVEIKSMNTFSYKYAAVSKNPHPHAFHQIQLYMHLTGIHKGLILIEDKNDQSFEVFEVDYDYKHVVPYLDRLTEIKNQLIELEENGIEPIGICKKEDCKKAQECNMRQACFHSSQAKRLAN